VGSKAEANEARYYFGVSADPSPEEIRAVVEHYPVFGIDEDRRTGGADRAFGRRKPGPSGPG
jgi:hypothetical protein